MEMERDERLGRHGMMILITFLLRPTPGRFFKDRPRRDRELSPGWYSSRSEEIEDFVKNSRRKI